MGFFIRTSLVLKMGIGSSKLGIKVQLEGIQLEMGVNLNYLRVHLDGGT